jgi:cytochrome c oxidase assembly protein subunit 15
MLRTRLCSTLAVTRNLRVPHIVSPPIPRTFRVNNTVTAQRIVQQFRTQSTFSAVQEIPEDEVAEIQPIHIPQRTGERAVRIWLITLAGMVFAIVIIGGLTRLTESGLSMVHWNLLGSFPPMNQQEWENEFDRYKQFPEYKKKNMGMTLEEFKKIFWYEYIHRQLGRVIGATFIIPACYFAARGYFNKATGIMPIWRVLTIGGLIGFQGLLGWYMVQSGLDENHDLLVRYNNVPRVSQYRLASHLCTAFVIYATVLWSVLDLDKDRKLALNKHLFASHHYLDQIRKLSRMKITIPLTTALMFITAASGAFVAGMDAGLVYNEFPLMGGKLIPSDLLALKPTILNFFENASTVQFQHRVLATATTVSMIALYTFARTRGGIRVFPRQMRLALNCMLGVVTAQYLLGITTLLTYVPTPIASMHQIGSLTLFTVMVWLTHLLRRVRV